MRFRLYRSRRRYWSCSKFSGWIRSTFGVPIKPSSATREGWQEWRRAAKQHNKVVYWIADDGLDALQDIVNFVPDIFYTVRVKLKQRFSVRAWQLDTKLGRYEHIELETRLLYGMFEALVDFVECEKAWMSVVWDDEGRKKYGRKWYHRFFKFRCPQAGLDYLTWEISLTNEEWAKEGEPIVPTQQALSAKETLELYLWWKNIRPNRPDPHDISGWSEYCNQHSSDDVFDIGTNREITQPILRKIDDIEQQYNLEDEHMMIRLIRIRQSLWT